MDTPPPYIKLPTISHDKTGLRVQLNKATLLLNTRAYIDRSEMGAYTSVFTDGTLIWISSYHYMNSVVFLEEFDPAKAVEGEPLDCYRAYYIEGWGSIGEAVYPRSVEGDEEDMFQALYQYLEWVD